MTIHVRGKPGDWEVWFDSATQEDKCSGLLLGVGKTLEEAVMDAEKDVRATLQELQELRP